MSANSASSGSSTASTRCFAFAIRATLGQAHDAHPEVAPGIERLRAFNLRILLTSGTVTSAAIVAKRFPPDVIHQYVPYDSPRYVARFLDHWQPSLALFIESDLWPNLILAGAARRLPMVLINGRMSPRSFPRWRRMYGTISALLSRFDICLAQSKTDAERFSALGGRDVVTTGNLKLDVPAPPADPAKLERLMAMTRGRPIIVAASTHPGEDEMLVAAHRSLVGFFPQLLTVIVPRHPDRGASIAGLITASGLKPALRSRDEPPAAWVAAQRLSALGLESSQVLDQLWGGPETLIVISSDLSHYEAYDRAREHDATTAAAIERLDAASLGPGDACGWLPVAGLLLAAGRRGMQVTRLDLRNSGDTAGPKDQVVGYGAWAFCET